jgi:glycosyltransferase EpsJ
MTNNNPKVSIVLPVYNVEKYLDQCLESIATQTYTNFEAIIVIDGSKDNSYEIAKKFCATHERFMVVWQENAGSGSARNNGIAHANGDLLMFVDPDDWIDNDYVEKMVKTQNEGDYDLVSAGGKRVTDVKGTKRISYQRFVDEIIVGQESVRKAYARLLCGDRLGGPHRKVYKTSIIKKHKVSFPDYRRSQDVVFNFRYYDCISSVCTIPLSGYNYRTSTDSYVKFHSDYYKTVVLIYDEIKQLHSKWNVSIADGILASFFLDYIFSHLVRCYEHHWPIDEVINNSTIKELIKTAHFLKKYKTIAQYFLKKRAYRLFYLFMQGLKRYRILKIRFCN